MAIKNCRVCGASFNAKANNVTCSKECRAKNHKYLVDRWYQENKVERIAQTTAWRKNNPEKYRLSKAKYNKAFYARALKPEAKKIITIFEALSDTERVSYAEWLLFLASAEESYSQFIKHHLVDDWIAAYAESAG